MQAPQTQAPRVHPIAIGPFGTINAFLITSEEGTVLVDTGIPKSEAKIEKVLNEAKRGWDDISLIVITHGHIDHAGSAASVRKRSGAPILLHDKDVALCRGAPVRKVASNWFSYPFRLTGIIDRAWPFFEADIVMVEPKFDLAPYGIDGVIVATPGHTQGSVSVVLDGGDVIAGDVLAGGILLGGILRRGTPKPPPFEEDKAQVNLSMRALLDAGGERFYLGHGGPVQAAAVRRYLRKRS